MTARLLLFAFGRALAIVLVLLLLSLTGCAWDPATWPDWVWCVWIAGWVCAGFELGRRGNIRRGRR